MRIFKRTKHMSDQQRIFAGINPGDKVWVFVGSGLKQGTVAGIADINVLREKRTLEEYARRNLIKVSLEKGVIAASAYHVNNVRLMLELIKLNPETSAGLVMYHQGFIPELSGYVELVDIDYHRLFSAFLKAKTPTSFLDEPAVTVTNPQNKDETMVTSLSMLEFS